MRLVIVAVVTVMIAALVLAALFFWRLHALNRRVGSFECSVHAGARWISGIADYTRDHLDFYEVVSLSLRPSRRWRRRELDILARRRRHLQDHPEPISEARCSYRGEEFVLTAADGALDGLRSWLEAAPPDPSTSRIV
ncbi:DUF2550 domain-containing protein [Ruania alkalisoli]|uniref:DUF2550 domain-containing protein n=1 Tax=Ruania alkalisoli TaxID=2779775 RepID=A0A7M1SQD7_9MICO|nr:DUF2550 family protein [Ruania alkalisoli]QOR69651.1 DUF2550 domain-containing protein [Ruania alkalisoli]